MNSSPPNVPGTWRLLAHGLHGDHVVDWALRTLELGYDTPHLRDVAFLTKPAALSDVERPSFLALQELGFPTPLSQAVIRRGYARDMAEAVVTGALSPLDAAHEMERYVVSSLNHPSDLQAWCFLESNLHPETYVTVSDQERDALLLLEAPAFTFGFEPLGGRTNDTTSGTFYSLFHSKRYRTPECTITEIYAARVRCTVQSCTFFSESPVGGGEPVECRRRP